MLLHPNAKINLGLHVVRRREDGYHDIETLFHPIPLCDELRISAADETIFTADGIAIDGKEDDNLVMKAYRLLAQDYRLRPVAVSLRKNIPFGAGLGGGSSDASAMLKLLNDYNDLGLSENALADYAARLGADCPFFVYNHPTFAAGTGNVFTPVHESFTLKGYHIVLIKPSVAISTPEAYRSITPRTPSVPLREVINQPIEHWRELLVNDFEAFAFEKHPLLATIKEQLYQKGALYAAMSGSGSTMFGLFRHSPDSADKLYPEHFTWQGQL